MNEDYVEGWKAARAQYQSTGGVQPYPPGYVAPAVEKEEAPPPVKKATRKPKEA